ncbi:PilZ domain-containing protein [Litoribrevibacter euphylliae]|uniref:PilZ domain-containing protein n=1 Tax=Litoribrevibacter euphylliae TaxID=1834034 RepID=A0ABV7HEN8_9GAMM
MLARDYQEKRNFIRMQMDVPATITLKHGNQVIQARCLDLSGNGMLIMSPEPIEDDAIFHIVISSTRPNLPPLEAEVKSMRCIEKDGQYEIGVIIEGIN